MECFFGFAVLGAGLIWFPCILGGLRREVSGRCTTAVSVIEYNLPLDESNYRDRSCHLAQRMRNLGV